MEHPFKRTDTTDVTVKIHGGETFYLHQQILSFYSTKFRDILNDHVNHHGDGEIKEISLDEDQERLEDLVTFFLFFYPEHFQQINFDVLDCDKIERLIALGKKYNTEWIAKPIEYYIIQKQDDGFVNTEENTEEIDYENCKRNIKGLLMGYKYKFGDLRLELMNFNYCPLDELQQIDGFDDLHDDDQIKLAMRRIPQAVDKDSVKTTFEIFNIMYKQTEEGIKQSKEMQGKPKDEESFNEGQNADMEIPSSGGTTFSVHSQILGFYSNIMTTEWQQDLSSSMGRDSKSPLFSGSCDKETIKAFLSLLYASNPVQLTKNTNFDQLLSLLSHYAIQWPIKRIEDFLIQTSHFNQKQRSGASLMWDKDIEAMQIDGLILADTYGLQRLQLSIIKNIKKARKFLGFTNFKKLSARSTYLVLRRCIQDEPRKIDDGAFSNEGKAIVKLLDKFYR